MVESAPLSKRLLPFDGMRGIAAVGVAAFHLNPSAPYLFWAWTFVDMFFVLSGFLIGSILYRGFADGTLSLKNFWMRRILRIWPVYYLTFAVVTIWALASPMHGLSPRALLQSVLFLQFITGYLHPGADGASMLASYPPWFGHSWSIAIEEQFYLILPVFLWLFGVRARSIFLIVIAALGLSEFLLHVNIMPCLLGSRMQGLALGLLLVPLSQWLRSSVGEAGATRRPLALVIIACGFIAGLYIIVPMYLQVIPSLGDSSKVDPEMAKAYVKDSILGMALIYFAIAGFVLAFPQGRLARLLSTPVLVYLGSISYAIYMFHVPVGGALTTLRGQPLATDSLMITLVYWVAIIGLASLSKFLIEDRFNAFKHRYPVYRSKT